MRLLIFAAIVISGCSGERDAARKAEIQAEIAAEEAAAVAALRAGASLVSRTSVQGGTITVLSVPMDSDETRRCVLFQGEAGAAIDCPTDSYDPPPTY